MGKKKEEAAAAPLPPEVLSAIDALKTKESSPEDKIAALDTLGSSACGVDVVRMDVVQAGILEPLLELMDKGTPASKEAAAYALRHLSSGNFLRTAYDNPSAIVMAGGIPHLVALVREGTTALQKEHAAATLCCLASKMDNRTAVAKEGAIPPLIALIRDGTEEQSLQAAFALGAIAFAHVPNQEAIRSAEGVSALEGLARRQAGNAKVAQVCAYGLRNLTPPPPVVVDPAGAAKT